MGTLKPITKASFAVTSAIITGYDGNCNVCEQPTETGAYFHGDLFGAEVVICLACLEVALNRLKEEVGRGWNPLDSTPTN